MDNIQDHGAHSAPENDLEKQLDKRLEELERQRAAEVDAALKARKAQEAEEQRRLQAQSLDAILKDAGVLCYLTGTQLVDLLAKNGLSQDEQGLKALFAKFPHTVDRRLGKKFLADVPEQAQKPKEKTRADFPQSRAEFKNDADKIEFIHLFGEDAWSALPSKPRASSVPLDKMTKADWQSLNWAQKTAIINQLTEQGRNSEEFIARLR